MGEFSLTHILLVLVVVLIFFGPSRLPSLGASMGKAIRGFKDGLKDAERDATTVTSEKRETLDESKTSAQHVNVKDKDKEGTHS